MQKNNTKLNFVFWGTPDVASETLEILKSKGFVPLCIITSPDRRSGRKMQITPTPVKIWAIENNVPYLQPEKFDQEFISQISVVNFDLFVVVAYGKIIPKEILNMPQNGSLNIHYSLLPKYRGASPVEAAVLNGDTETGVTIQQMEFKLDSGPIVSKVKVPIPLDEKAPELRKRLIVIGANLLAETLPRWVRGEIKAEKQKEEEATYCGKIKKEDGEIDLSDDPEKNFNKFRAYAAWPRTFFFKDGKRIIITDAALVDGKFVIKKILPEGKKEMPYISI